MSRSLAVLLYGRVIGTVEQSTQGRRTFTYAPGYGGPDATPLSLSMPVAAEAYTARRIDPYLEGLLPDATDVRERWAGLWGVSPNNPFALLEHMGLDCAGAVQFVPAGDVDAASTRPGDLTAVTDEQIGRRLAALRTDDTSWAVAGERWSLAGAQGKFTLARDRAGRWHEPNGAAASTHIVKPGMTGLRSQALNEHLCLRTAAALGVDAARSEYLTFAGEPAVVVARYDRRRRGETVVRVHQEDMCQALSVYPRRKYENRGGPGVATIAALLWDRATDPVADVRTFLTAVVFNYLIGAPDAHAKNYSVLLAGREVRLAPIYDVASGLPYEPTREDAELDSAAMSMGGRRTFGQVAGHNWDKMARQCRVPGAEVRDVVTDLASCIPDALDTTVNDQESVDDELAERLTSRVRALCTTTLSLMAE